MANLTKIKSVKNIFDVNNTSDLPDHLDKIVQKRPIARRDSIINRLKELFKLKNELDRYEIMVAYYRKYKVEIKYHVLSTYLFRLVKDNVIYKQRGDRYYKLQEK
jgi:hypothetical protein